MSVQTIKTRIITSVSALVVVLSGLMVFSPAMASAGAYDCSPVPGHASVCIDPTTGYGPVVLVYALSGVLVWSSGVTAACTTTHRIYFSKNDNVSLVIYSGIYNGVYDATAFSSGYNPCTGGSGALMSQTTMDNFRWYSNYYGTSAARTVF